MENETTAREEQILASLREQFPGTLSINIGQALAVTGYTTSERPDRVARQAIYRGSYPFPLTMIGSARRVLLADIARAMAASLKKSPTPSHRSSNADSSHADMIECD